MKNERQDDTSFLSTFDHIIMHMKLFLPTCDAIARAVEPAKEDGLTGVLSMEDIEAFCKIRGKACESANRPGRRDSEICVTMDASEWAKRFDLETNEDGTVSVDNFAVALRSDADLASSPGLLHALCTEFDLYPSEMLRFAIASDRKSGRDVKSKNPHVLSVVDAVSKNATMSNDELLEFCKTASSSLPQRMPVLFIRISRLGNVQSDSGIDVETFSRCVELRLIRHLEKLQGVGDEDGIFW